MPKGSSTKGMIWMKLHPIQEARNRIKTLVECSSMSETDKDFISADLAIMMREHAILYSKMEAMRRILNSKQCEGWWK